MNIAILGSGGMGRAHARQLLRSPGVRLNAVCARTAESGSRWRADTGSDAAVYTDFERMLDAEPLDALYVCLPPDAHNGQVELAAARGIHLFLEKPIALGAEPARRMVEAIERAGVISQVGYHLRFRKSAQRLRELIDAGTAGRPTLFEGRFWCNMAGLPWWRSAERSGGQTYEQAIHLYDLALHFLGTPQRAWGQIDRLCHAGEPDYDIEDTGIGMLRFENGAMATVSTSNCAIPDRYIADFRAVFEHATLEYRSSGDSRVPPEAFLIHHATEQRFVEVGDLQALATAAFLGAVRGERTSPAPARDGLLGIQTVAAVLRSAAAGGSPVDIDAAES